ncbi:hypothetical protein AAHB66_07240 [Leclercia sp. S52]|uniref:hypothetical protein n=1 Tax=Leclercia sp. S52 TaxID=3138178 RepID=UPI00321B4C04
MKLLLITNSKEAEPGYLVTKNTKKDFLEIYKENLKKENLFQLMFSYSFLKSGYTYFYQDECELQTIKIDKPSGQNDIWSKIMLSSLIINKKAIISGGVKYDNSIFKGLFKTENHFQEVIKSLPSTDSEIFICDIGTVNACYIEEISSVGIYVVNAGQVIPSVNYSDQMWSYIREGIINVFGNLNAKKINLIDETVSHGNANISLTSELKKLSAEIGLSFDRKSTYALYSELNGTLDTLKAEQSLSSLDLVPSLRALAKQMIDNPNHLKKGKSQFIFRYILWH